jgi:hypothetical protein
VVEHLPSKYKTLSLHPSTAKKKNLKTQSTEWEKYFKIMYLIRELYLEYRKNSYNSMIKRQKYPVL